MSSDRWNGYWLAFLAGSDPHKSQLPAPESFERGLPRSVDIALGGAVLVLALPILAVIAAAITSTSRGGILYRHRRVGRGGRPFDVLKFRTMRPGLGGPAVTIDRDPRVTRVGRILRKSKLDELPTLWNVIRGDMALVGPRPEAIQYVDPSSEVWREILKVRPGLTDPVTLRLRNEEDLLAAVGANYESFYRFKLLPYKLNANLEYIAARSWRNDVALLWLTLLAIVFPSRVPPPTFDDIANHKRTV